MSSTGYREEIAIVGMAGRFPGARDVDEFWANLCNGVESIRPFTDEELAASGSDPSAQSDPDFVNAGAVMDGADQFDAAFFGMSRREAELTDPQHRVFLECAWEAIEHAGYSPRGYAGRIGVFGGVAANTYYQQNLAANPDLLESTGNYPLLLASEREYAITRVAYKLGLEGPAISVNTACSTSAVAVHLASQSLLAGESDLVLAGGARIRVPLTGGYVYQEDGILSPDGHCRAYDAGAKGTVVASGAAVVALKRLSDARLDGDTVYAIIKGSAVNNDGAAKVGYTAPGVQGQAAVIREALAVAEVSADTIGMVEGHGTGTSLGDPIEVSALTEAFAPDTARRQYCALGSLKTNIGHLDAGAGVAGIIKAALSLYHRQIPPSLNFESPNPHINFAESPFFVNTELREWPRVDQPRRAGVSSFGLGGTNAHVVLEEAPPDSREAMPETLQVLPLSAKTATALESKAVQLGRHMADHPDLELRDVAFTLQTGRERFEHRGILVAAGMEDASAVLISMDPNRMVTRTGAQEFDEIAFLFTGQGAQYVNMGRDLYETETLFRHHVDACSQALEPHLGLDLRSILYPDGESEVAAETLRQTEITQPALFTIEYSLAQLWMSWGIVPQAMVGHSIGEYVAACLAGVFPVADTLKLVAARGRLMQGLPSGAMLAVPLTEEETLPFLGDSLSLAAVNGPRSCVVSGDFDAIAALNEQLERQEIEAIGLRTSHAFHSSMMDPILAPFMELFDGMTLNPPSLPFVSNVTGTWISPEEATDPGYWARHIRSTVRFADCLSELLQHPTRALLEVGPGSTLTNLARRMPDASGHTILGSFGATGSETSSVLETLGRLWLAGFEPDWRGWHGDQRPRRVPLPTYPFERERFWIEARAIVGTGSPEVDATPGGSGESGREHATSQHGSWGDSPSPAPETGSRRDRIATTLTAILADLSGVEASGLDRTSTFIDLGFDSLFLTQANSRFRKQFGLRITFRQLFEEAPSIDALADYIEGKLPPEARFAVERGSRQQEPTPATQPDRAPIEEMLAGRSSALSTDLESTPSGLLERVINEQLRIMDEQLELIKRAERLPEKAPALSDERQPDRDARSVSPVLAQQDPSVPGTGKEDDSMLDEVSPFPLTEAQQEIWLTSQFSPDASCAYNLSNSLHLTGPLDRTVLENAIRELINSHDSLRLRIDPLGEQQWIDPVGRVVLAVADLSELTETAREHELDQARRLEVSTPFDLETGPLIRFRLFKIGLDLHRLFITTHHIACDGTSLQLLERRLSRLYSNALHNRSTDVTWPQFRDFADWLTGIQGSDIGLEDETYWAEEFVGQAPILDVPTDRPRPPVQTFSCQRLGMDLDGALLERLRKHASDRGMTLFTLLIGAYDLLLGRLTGETDIVVGVFAAGQPEFGSEVVGHCVSLLPVRMAVSGDETPGEFLSRVRSKMGEAYDHKLLTLGGLVRRLRIARNASRLPLVATTVTLQTPPSGIEFEGLAVEVENHQRISSIFDLELYMKESETALHVDFQFKTDLFDEDTIRAWMDHYRVLLENITGPNQARNADLPVLTSDQWLSLVSNRNDTSREVPPLLMHEMFEANAKRVPEAWAVVVGEERISYRDLNARANQLARHLRSSGVRPGSVVGVRTRRSIDMVVGLLGVHKAGGAYLPLDPAFPAERISFMTEDSGLSILVTQEALRMGPTASALTSINLDSDWDLIAQHDPSDLERTARPSDLAYLIYTSGSTGQPKGVEVLHTGLVNLLTTMAVEPGFAETDALLAVTTLSFDIAALELFLPLVTGATVVIARELESADPSRLAALISAHGINVMQATPATWQLLVDVGWEGNLAMRAWCGGEALNRPLADELDERVLELWNLYGPTETTIWSSVSRVEASDGPVPIGHPVANTEFYVLDGYMNPVPVGATGELYIGGAGLARGYHNRPHLSEERFVSHPFSEDPEARLYRTGDLVRSASDGTLAFLGRSDNQIKIRGFRVELGEIEECLNAHPAVKEAVVVAREDQTGHKRLIAYLISRQTDVPTVTEIRSFLRESLPDYMVPSVYVPLAEFPLTPNKKIDRLGLPEPLESRLNSADSHVAPVGTLEQQLVFIWQDILDLEPVGTHDNFFDLGGDSILVMRAIAKSKMANINIRPVSMFEHQTIAELASFIESADSHVVEDQDVITGPTPLTPAQIRFLYERNTADPHHWNFATITQAMSLESKALAKALAAVLEHHDALRLRLTQEDGIWRQEIVGLSDSLPFTTHNVAHLSHADRVAFIEEHCTSLQESLDLARGPIMRMAHFICGPEEPDRLFVTVHHFAIDGLTWPILQKDLETAYQQAAVDDEITLPPKTTSFKAWAEELNDLARSPRVAGAVHRWLELPWEEVGALPVDFDTEGKNTNGSAELIDVEFGVEETAALLGSRAAGRVDHVLITALAHSLSTWTSSDVVLIDILGHGRDAAFETADLSRTVGFTLSYNPLVLRVSPGEPASSIAPSLVDQILATPDGFGFDLLRFFAADAEVRDRLTQLPRAEVLFNYSRMSSHRGETYLFEHSAESIGPSASPRGTRQYPLAVRATLNDRLRVSFVYSSNLHTRQTIELLAERFRSTLGEIIAHYSESLIQGPGGPTDLS